jgi:hypothetical protein
MRFCDAESENGTKKSQKRISFVSENAGEAVGPQNVLCLLNPRDQEVNAHVFSCMYLHIDEGDGVLI